MNPVARPAYRMVRNILTCLALMAVAVGVTGFATRKYYLEKIKILIDQHDDKYNVLSNDRNRLAVDLQNLNQKMKDADHTIMELRLDVDNAEQQVLGKLPENMRNRVVKWRELDARLDQLTTEIENVLTDARKMLP